jgi:toxin FitB
VVKFLLDTNVLSESSRAQVASAKVLHWQASVHPARMFISVISIGEIRRGIEKARPKQPDKSLALDSWLINVGTEFKDRILPVDDQVAQLWGRLSSGQTRPILDTYLAATALVHGLTVATRNTKDFAWTGVPTFDPFVG